MIHFDLPKEKSSILKVIGVGGGGSNAVNHMFSQNIDNVNFIICNTDAQALAQSHVPNKIQLGPHLTQGLGAGANPEIGKQATEESLEEIKRILEVNTKMAFITAGMGGGTGTGGAPIISKICKDLGILTVGIVTTPFAYEGKRRQQQAEEGIEQLKQYVDTLLVISNDKLRHQFGNLKMKDAFAKADNVLATAAKCITDVINSTGQINVDFADVCTVMRNGGVAILGSATAEGDTRAQKAIEEALNSPLLNDNDIRGAKWILININSSEGEHEFTMDEVEVIQNYLLSHAGDDTDVILGLGYDSTLDRKIGITLIATGFEHKTPFFTKPEVAPEPKKEEKIVMTLNVPTEEQKLYKQVVTPVEARTERAPRTEGPHVQKPHVEKPRLDRPTAERPAVEKPTMERQREVKPVQEKAPVVVDALSPTLTEMELFDPKPSVKIFIDEKPVKKSVVENEAVERYELAAPEPAFARPNQKILSLFAEPSVEPFNIKPQLDQKKEIAASPIEKNDTFSKQHPSTLTGASGGYLAKPANIYIEPEEPLNSLPKQPDQPPVQKEEEPLLEMQLVIKDDIIEEDQAAPTDSKTLALEDLPITDEVEEQKRRASERVQKLRNLSFNINGSDSKNEFETVPAYIRRNLELYNTVNNVENFYSNYTVKPDENNKSQISTINTFLDGKKPD